MALLVGGGAGPLLVLLGIATIVAVAAVFSGSAPSNPVEWLARLLTSESSNPRVWPLIAATARNVAARRGHTLERLLRTEVVREQEAQGGTWRTLSERTVTADTPGPQYREEASAPGKRTTFTRWASTRQAPSSAALQFAQRWVNDQLTPAEAADAARVGTATSFFEAAPAYAGRPGQDPAAQAALKRWGARVVAEEGRWLFAAPSKGV